MSDDRKDLPPVGSPNFLEKVREALSTYLGNRGDKLDRGVTLRDLSESGIVSLRPGYLTYGGGAPVSGSAVSVPVYEADLTPPPLPTGFAATAGLGNLHFSHDAPTYTQGHGHAKTVVYGATYTTGPLPVFADAVVITEFSGTVFSHPSNLGVEWHLWIKWVSVDGVASAPAGGVNGVVATTGKIGNTDLLPLIIEAGNLASGAVTGSKLAALAVDATKFASGIEPVTVVSTVPGTLVTKTIFNTTDGKLYRWSGTAYVATVPTTDLTGAITATQITDGAISTPKLAAGAITTAKLAAGAVTASEIAANTITGGQIAAGAISATEIAAGAIIASKISANAIAVGTAAIQNGAIVNAMIGNATIDDAKIASLNVSKLVAGSIAVGQYVQSTGYVAGSAGWRINGDGTAELSGVVVRGAVFASSGTFAGSLSGANITGATGTFSGTLAVNNGASSRIVITSDKIEVWNLGVLRVKMGNLA